MTASRVRLPALAAALVVMVVGLVALVVPFLTKEHRVAAAIPQPAPLFSVDLVQVEPGERACLTPITLPERGDVVEVKVGTFGAPPIPFTLTLSGGGYTASARVKGGYVDNQTVSVPVTPPSRAVRGAACVRNDGRSRLGLYAANDRTRTPATTTVDGRRQSANFQLAFYELRPATVAERVPEVAERLAVFRPVGPWFVWLVGLLVVVGIPIALVAAFALSLRDPE